MEDLEVTSVSGRIIAGWCAAHRSEVRLVHELCGCDSASYRAGVGGKAGGRGRCPTPAAQTPVASRVPGLMANDVTICAPTACDKSTTPCHCSRVKTPLNPEGGADGAESESAKQVAFAHVR